MTLSIALSSSEVMELYSKSANTALESFSKSIGATPTGANGAKATGALPTMRMIDANLDPYKLDDLNLRPNFQAYHTHDSLGLGDWITMAPPSSACWLIGHWGSLDAIEQSAHAAGTCAKAYAHVLSKQGLASAKVCHEAHNLIVSAFAHVAAQAHHELSVCSKQVAGLHAPEPERQAFEALCKLVGDEPSVAQKAALRWSIGSLLAPERLALMAQSSVAFGISFLDHDKKEKDDMHDASPFFLTGSLGHEFKNFHRTHTPLDIAKALNSSSFNLQDDGDKKAFLATPDGTIRGASEVKLWARHFMSALQAFDIASSTSLSADVIAAPSKRLSL